MPSSAPALNAREAARRLGVSAKALRLYEQRGLVTPLRSAAGWRVYGPAEMRRAGDVAALRRLGLTLAQVAQVLRGGPRDLQAALAAHHAELEARLRRLVGMIETVGSLRGDLARAAVPAAEAPPGVAFALPWPWGGERFVLGSIKPLTYIIGPLGSGKTRLAQCLAAALPGAAFLGLDRLAEDGTAAQVRMAEDPALAARVDRALAALVAAGAADSDALVALLAGLEADGPAILVVDMMEQGLDAPSQAALIARLRRRGPQARPLFLLTRSRAILDLGALGADEAIILWPANHSPPVPVAPYPGTPGYEAVATCLASPAVRARTEGVIAWRPGVA